MYRCNACTSVWLLVIFCLFFYSRWLGGKCLLERAWNGCICIGGGGGDRLLEVVGWRSGGSSSILHEEDKSGAFDVGTDGYTRYLQTYLLYISSAQ